MQTEQKHQRIHSCVHIFTPQDSKLKQAHKHKSHTFKAQIKEPHNKAMPQKQNLESVLLHSPITGCTNNIAAIPTQSDTISKEALISSIDTSIPSFCIITEYRELDEFYLTPSFYENRECKESLIASQSRFYTTYKPIDIRLDSPHNAIDCSGIESHTHLKDIVDSLLPDYSTKYFSYRILTIRVAYSIYEYIFIVPKKIPNFILKLLKEQRHSDELDYGYMLLDYAV